MRVKFRLRVKFRNRVKFRLIFIVPGRCASCRAKVFSPGGSMSSSEQINPGGCATRKDIGETVRCVAREVTWYLKYQVMLPNGRQTYNQVYASMYTSSYKTWQ